MNFPLIEYTIRKINDVFPNIKRHYGITTNAFYLKGDILDFITKWMDFNLSVSIDGTPEVNDSYRIMNNGLGTFEKIEENIKALLKKRADLFKVRYYLLHGQIMAGIRFLILQS